MKKIYTFIITALACISLQAQTHVRVWQSGESNRMKIANVGDMAFSNGTITLKGTAYDISTIDSIIVVPEITVAYSGSSATVSVPDAIASDITVEQSGAHVTITNTNVSNEIEVVLSGTSTDGSLTYNGSYKCTIQLNDLSLTSTTGSPLNILCGKRVALELADGTTNTLVDAASGSQKACLYCKGHLEIEDGGTLNITGNTKHGIATKEYLQLKKSTGSINIVSAAGDGIHAGQYFLMNGGAVTMDSNTIGDGIQVETCTYDSIDTSTGDTLEVVDPDKEDNGRITINGGTITLDINSEDCKGIKCDSLVTINGGTITINAIGNGSRGIQTDGNMTINETDSTVPTTITIAAKGGLCTQAACSSDPHRCMGIKVDGNLTVTGGTTTVTNTGTKSRGIKVGGYTKTGGTVNANIKY